MSKKLFALFCLILIGTFSMAVYADSTEPSESEERIGWASEKITRGVTNIATGWLEVPQKIDKNVKEKGALEGTIVGVAEGLIWGLYRTGAGLVDLVTSPLGMIKPDEKPVIDPPTLFEK